MDQPRQRPLPVWPFALVCAALFILTLRAPPAWQKIAVPNVERILARRPRPYDNRELLRAAVPKPQPATATVFTTLAQTEAPRQVAPTQPRVANRIVPPPMDPVILPEASPSPAPVEASPEETNPQPEFEFTPADDTIWPEPGNLKVELEQLLVAPTVAPWAQDVLDTLAALREAPALSSPVSGEALEELEHLSVAGRRLAENERNGDVARQLRRTQYALARRLDIWQAVHAAAQRPQPRMRTVVERGQLANRVAVVEDYFQGIDASGAWERYLNLPETRQLAESRAPRVQDVAAVAYRTLGRLEEPSLTEAQRAVLHDARVRALVQELRKYLSDPADLPHLLVTLEAFELNTTTANSTLLARTSQRLRWSTMPELRTVGEKLDLHYRNANLRVAVRGDLINRLLPVVQTMREPVNDEILGAQVQGTSEVSSELAVRLIPDDRRLSLALQAHGHVASDTEANHGSVTFYNQGQSQYVAEKVLHFDRLGLQAEAATASANSVNSLTGISSSYDNVPLLGPLVRMAASNRQAALEDQANYEAQQRVSDRARTRLETEVAQRLEQSEKRLRDKMLAPLTKLDLSPVPLELQTTPERMVARCRLATTEQLGAFTPRPLALSDSLMSVQVHESLLNNVIAQLKLDGRRVPLDELYRELAAATGRNAAIPDDLPEGVVVQFAPEDALRIHLADGRLTMVIRLAELSQGKQNRWKNFEVRGYFQPNLEARTPTLVREGSIELVGEKLGLRDQVALRGIFSKVLDKKKPIPLIDPRLLADARMSQVAVTQLTLEYGWLGLALGPNRVKPELEARKSPTDQR